MRDLILSVIIPVFNKWELTVNCLESLKRYTPGADFEVIVVDNGSSDATATELGKLGEALFGERFIRIRNEVNSNFGPACNAGADAARAPLLFFLNNDTLLTENWLPPLLEAFASDSALGAVGPLLLYENHTVQHLGVTYSSMGLNHLYAAFPKNHPVVRKKRRLQFLTAAALLLPKPLFFEVGRFFEGYRNGFEDVDLCVRIGEAGKKLICEPESIIFHLESQSQGRRDHETRNSEILYERCGRSLYPDLHHHGLRDGFRTVVNEMLGESLLLKEEEDLELRALCEGRQADFLYGLVKQHPLWLWGHHALAGILEKHGELSDAAGLCVTAFLILPEEGTAKKVLRLARLLQNPELAAMSETWLQNIISLKFDKKKRDLILLRNIATADRFRDRLLGDLYRRKMGENI